MRPFFYLCCVGVRYGVWIVFFFLSVIVVIIGRCVIEQCFGYNVDLLRFGRVLMASEGGWDWDGRVGAIYFLVEPVPVCVLGDLVGLLTPVGCLLPSYDVVECGAVAAYCRGVVAASGLDELVSCFVAFVIPERVGGAV